VTDAITELYQELGRQCLPAPPIPPALSSQIRTVGEQQWGTEEFDPEEQYLHAPHVARLVADTRPEPLWCFGYWGHGTNSYAYSLTCRLGPVALAMQGHWVPWVLYNNAIADAAELASIFQVARALIEVAGDQPGPVRVLVDASRFRDGYSVTPVAHLTGAGRTKIDRALEATARRPISLDEVVREAKKELNGPGR